MVHPLTSDEFLFKMALSSAWQTVKKGRGKRSHEEDGEEKP